MAMVGIDRGIELITTWKKLFLDPGLISHDLVVKLLWILAVVQYKANYQSKRKKTREQKSLIFESNAKVYYNWLASVDTRRLCVTYLPGIWLFWDCVLFFPLFIHGAAIR